MRRMLGDILCALGLHRWRRTSLEVWRETRTVAECRHCPVRRYWLEDA